MGGDIYRIGMGGGAVSSVAKGEYGNAIETECSTACQSGNAKESL
jgi:phosphoribosylformylglycinamidine (FGAM) synthase-like enzyme